MQQKPSRSEEYRKICIERSRKWRIENKERIEKYKENLREKDPIMFAALMLFRNAKRRAGKRGLEFSLPLDWIVDALNKGRCCITGIPFDLFLEHRGKHSSPWSPSLDRIDSRQGYTKDNVQVVVWAYNHAKMDFTHYTVITLAKALVGASC